jgi:CobQ-like glutamine amidotransferase family enzyme
VSGDPLRVAVLFPELLGTYGDGGNALVLRQRMRWRGLPVEVQEVALRDPVPASCDLYVLGGGEDEAQLQALAALRASPALARAVAAGVPVFAVCAGLQLLGTSVTTRDGSAVPGLGLLDAATGRLNVRAVGEVTARPDPELALPPLAGFTNHAGSTVLGPQARPLATVLSGHGNAGPGGVEGALQGSVVATYLHGPVLARNPALADLLLARALGRALDPLEPA